MRGDGGRRNRPLTTVVNGRMDRQVGRSAQSAAASVAKRIAGTLVGQLSLGQSDAAGPQRTLKPPSVEPPDVVREADHESMITSTKPTTLGALHDRERDRAAAHLLGQRPEDVPAVERQEREQVDDRSDSEISARIASARAVSKPIAWRVTS